MVASDNDNDNILKGYSMLLYFGGSFILGQPEESSVFELASSDIFKKMPVRSHNPNFILASSFLNKVNENGELDYESILDDHLKLFGGMGVAKAPPYESVYLSHDHLMNQEQTLQVKRIYQTYAWNPSLNGKIPEDHLGIELQFLNMLLEKFIEIDDGVCKREVHTDMIKFIDNHIIKWLPEWNTNLQQNAVSPFYKGIGYLILASIQDVRSLLV